MISKNISYKEGVYSNTAIRLGINNTPDDEQLECMELIAEKVFQPLREWVGKPIKINSFFREKKPHSNYSKYKKDRQKSK